MKRFKIKAVRKLLDGQTLKQEGEKVVREWVINGNLFGERDAIQVLVGWVIYELGDGDGENGGKGSLKNCVEEIWNEIYHTGRYEYADMIFTMEVVNA